MLARVCYGILQYIKSKYFKHIEIANKGYKSRECKCIENKKRVVKSKSLKIMVNFQDLEGYLHFLVIFQKFLMIRKCPETVPQGFRHSWIQGKQCVWLIETDETAEKRQIRRVFTLGTDESMLKSANFNFPELCSLCLGFAKIGMVCKELSEFLKWKMVTQYTTENSGKFLFVQYVDRMLVFRVQLSPLHSTGKDLYNRVKSELISMIQEKCNDCAPFETNVSVDIGDLMQRLTVQEEDNPKATPEVMDKFISQLVDANEEVKMGKTDSTIISKNVVSYELVANSAPPSFHYRRGAILPDEYMSMTIKSILQPGVQ